MQNDKKYTVLFVCSSNVCRSPYCEFMLRRMVENDDDLRGKVDVCSSAVFNRSKSIFPKALDILKGKDLTSVKSLRTNVVQDGQGAL